MSSNRIVHLLFVTAGILLGWFVLVPTTEWIWSVVANDPRPPDLWVHGIGLALAAAGTYAAWSNPRVFGLASEVSVEASKVTWPTRTETKWAAIVVVVTVAIASSVLALFDAFWSWTTGKLYG